MPTSRNQKKTRGSRVPVLAFAGGAALVAEGLGAREGRLRGGAVLLFRNGGTGDEFRVGVAGIAR